MVLVPIQILLLLRYKTKSTVLTNSNRKKVVDSRFGITEID